jgi:hypothetical protein
VTDYGVTLRVVASDVEADDVAAAVAELHKCAREFYLHRLQTLREELRLKQQYDPERTDSAAIRLAEASLANVLDVKRDLATQVHSIIASNTAAWLRRVRGFPLAGHALTHTTYVKLYHGMTILFRVKVDAKGYTLSRPM